MGYITTLVLYFLKNSLTLTQNFYLKINKKDVLVILFKKFISYLESECFMGFKIFYSLTLENSTIDLIIIDFLKNMKIKPCEKCKKWIQLSQDVSSPEISFSKFLLYAS